MRVKFIGIKEAVKFFTILFIIAGYLICIPLGSYSIIYENDFLGGLLVIVFGPAIAGIDGAILGFIMVVLFNFTSKLSGGIRLELES